MKIGKKLILTLLLLFAFVSLSYAEKERKSKEKGQMPVASESSGDAKEMVKHKNTIQEAEKEQCEESDEKDANSEKQKEDDEDKEEKTREDEEGILKIQGFEDQKQIQTWLEDLLGRPLDLSNSKDKAIYDFWCGLLDKGYSLEQIGNLIDTVGLAKKTIDFWYNGSFYEMGRVDLNDVNDHKALFNWASLILQGFSPQDVRLLIILTKTFRKELKNYMIFRTPDVTKLKDVKIIAGWSLYRRQGYSAEGVYNLFKNRLIPEIEKLIPNFDLRNPEHAGFFTFWCEEALARLEGGLDYTVNLLDAMSQIREEVEALIGEVDFLDKNYQDNGFITYWAEKAISGPEDFVWDNKHYTINWSIQYVKDFLKVLKDLNQRLTNPIDVFDPNDMGKVTNWIHYILTVKGVRPGEPGYEELLEEVVNYLENEEPAIEALKPLIIEWFAKLGLNYDDNNPKHHGYLMFWVSKALSGDISPITGKKWSIDYAKHVLSNMIAIYDYVNLILNKAGANLDIFDPQNKANGYLTFWAEMCLKGKDTFSFGNETYEINWNLNYVRRVLGNIYQLYDLVAQIVNKAQANLDIFDPQNKANGYLTFWAQVALLGISSPITGKTWDLNYTKSVLNNIIQIYDLVVQDLATIGENLDIFDKDNKGNGYLAFWAEKALYGDEDFDYGGTIYKIHWDINYVKDFLTVVRDINQRLNNKIDLFDKDDMGRLSYWINYILTVKGIRPGEPGYEELLEEVVNYLEESPPVAEELKPYIEELFNKLGIAYDENNPDHKGFLDYWARLVVDEVVDEDGFKWTLENTKAVLENMAQIVDEVKNLIGEIDLFDKNYRDNGFLTFWAKEIVKGNRTLESTKMLLSDMAYLRPIVERGIGRTLDLFDPDDSGLLSYWANEVQRIMDEEGLSHEEALAKVEQIIKDTYNIQGNITFYMNDDEVVFFDKNGNILFRYTLPSDEDHTEYRPLYVLISPDDTHAVIIWERIEHTSDINPHHPDRHYFYYTKILFGDNPKVDVVMGNFYGNVNHALMTPDGNYLMIGYCDDSLPDKVMFINLINNSQIKTSNILGGPGRIVDMISAPDSKRMYLISDNAYVTIFDPQTGEVLATIETPWYYTSNWEGKLYISDDGKVLSIVDKDGNEVKYDVSDLNNIHQIPEIPDEIIDALKPYIEQLLGSYDENNPQHQGFINYWGEQVLDLINQGLSQDEAIAKITTLLNNMIEIKPQVEALIGKIDFLDDDYQDNGFISFWANKIGTTDEYGITWSLEYTKQVLSNMKELLPEVEALIGKVNFFDDNHNDDGFLTTWAQKVGTEDTFNDKNITWTLEYTKQVLNYMKQIWDNDFDNNGQKDIEELIGQINLLDGNYQDNGFLTYWAQTAIDVGDVNKIKQRLYIWKRLLPPIEQKEGRKLDLFNPDDSGIVSYWSSEVEKRIDQGMSLEDAIQEVINLILQPEPTVYEELIPYIEQLLGVQFDENNPQHMGFLTYWSQRADKEGLEKIENLLQAMIDVKDDVENLIGKINFLDDDPSDDGFITYWAEQAVQEGTQKVETLLSNMVQIKDEVEALIGEINFLDDNYQDNGFITYWAEYAIDVGVERVKKLLDNMAQIRLDVEALIGEIDFLDDNYNDNGFITYWAEYAIDNGLEKTKNILQAMNQILNNDWDNNGKSEIEELIGEINFFDHNYQDNGFLTYWAEQALSRGVGDVEMSLYIWKRLLPYVEDYEGKELNLFDPNDSGIISYWESRVRQLLNQGMGLEEAIQEVIDLLSQGSALASFLYKTSDNLSKFFQEGIGIDPQTGLPYSFITTTSEGEIYHNFFTPEYTTLSDIAMHIVSLISLAKLDKLSHQELKEKIAQLLNTLYTLPYYSPESGEFKDNIYFFNYYTLPDKKIAFNKFISSVDNANLVMALILAREACPELKEDLNALIDKIDLSFFYDKTAHLFLGGYEYDPNSQSITPSNFHYGILNTETRLISYLAIGKHDLDKDEANLHWQALTRTLKNVDGIDIMASYGGSLFEFLYPSLFIDEAGLSPEGFGLNFKKAVLLQKLQAIENGYPFWGEAPCFDEIYEYNEFGSEAGINPYSTRGILAPYAILLALNAIGEGGDLIKLIENLYQGSIQSDTGMVDAIDINNDLAVYLKSTLLQGIALASIANITNNSIRGLFMGSPEAQDILSFIHNERFFTENQIESEMHSVHDAILDSINQNKWREAKALFDYFKDLVITYNKQAEFSDLNQLETNINTLLSQNLNQLYHQAQNYLANNKFQEVIKSLQIILYYQPDYQNANELLMQARAQRDALVSIPDLQYLITSFEEGCRPNHFVKKIGPVDGPGGRINVGIVQDEDLSQGKVMKLNYTLQPGGFNGVYINTHNLSLSKDYIFSLDIKGDSSVGIPDKVKIEFHINGVTYSFQVDNITDKWQRLEFSLADLFPQLPDNFNIEQIAIIFEGDNVGNNQGAIYIDNLAFKK